MSALAFGSISSKALPSDFAWIGSGQLAWRAYLDAGAASIKIDNLTSQGYVTASTVVVDSTTTALTDTPLNEPMCLDPVTGRLHLVYAAHSNDASNLAVLYHRSSTDNGATWSARHTLDSTNHGGNSRFFRVGIVAYNDFASLWYTSENNSTFTTDGLWEIHSSDGGATWSAPAKAYTTPVCPFEPNVELGPDGTMHVSWYDPGVVANQGGDVYYVSGTFNGSGWTWPASPTRLTTGETWGRTRVLTSNGVVMIVGNTNWGGTAANVGLLRSTDNGATWSATVTIATHTTGALDHPWGEIDSLNAMIIWVDHATTPLTYKTVLSTDAGATWGAPFVPLTTGGNSDAPRLVFCDDVVTAVGYDNVASPNVGLWAFYPLFAPTPQQSSSAIIDAFNRANENPLSNGGKWSADSLASNNLKLVSNAVTRQLAAGSFDRSGNYRNDISVSGGYELYVDCTTAGGELDLFLWASPSLKNGYDFDRANGDFGTGGAIVRYDGGVGTTLITEGVLALTAGETYLIRVDQNDVTGMRLDGSGNWTEVLRVTDTTYRSTLQPGLEIVGQVGAPVVDNFGGGALNAPSNSVAPVATMTGGGYRLSVKTGTWATSAGATPTRYTYQWQQSTDGGSSWANISRATLPFYAAASTSGLYRCQVTGKNSLGTATATSNTITTPTGARIIFGRAA